ncbi:MAG: hypothetical protein WCR19_04025, partial [Acholeplasmataceae bacterium]
MYEIQNNLLSIIIALILYFSLKLQVYRLEHVNKLFSLLIWSTIGILFLESIMLGLNGTSGVFNHTILAITLVIYFIMVPIVSFLSVIFLDFEIYKNNYQFQKKHSIYIIVIIISIILSILSI